MKHPKGHTPDYEYEYFVTTYIGAAAQCKPTKPRAKCTVSLESQAVKKKWDNLKNTSLKYKIDQTNFIHTNQENPKKTPSTKNNYYTSKAKSMKLVILY